MSYNSGETGKLFESSRLLSKDQSDKVAAEGRDFSQTLKKVPYKNLQDAVKEIIEKNPYLSDESESWDPPSPWLNDLHIRLANALGIKDFSKLRVYPALGTAADIYHKMDLLVACIDPETDQPALVSVDLGLNPEKAGGNWKSDVIVSDVGAIVNPAYDIEGYDIPDLEHSSKAEDKKRAEIRMKKLAEIIAEILIHKTTEGDPLFTTLATRLRIKEILDPKKAKVSGAA